MRRTDEHPTSNSQVNEQAGDRRPEAGDFNPPASGLKPPAYS